MSWVFHTIQAVFDVVLLTALGGSGVIFCSLGQTKVMSGSQIRESMSRKSSCTPTGKAAYSNSMKSLIKSTVIFS